MTQFALALDKLHLDRSRVLAALRPHARPLTLACGLAGALAVWSMPAAQEARCMLVAESSLSWQTGTSLSIALTALAWYVHKPVLQRVRTIRQRFARD
jgi:hypothetical protein